MSLDSSALSRFCSNCGGKITIDDKFCGTCGVSRQEALGEYDPKIEQADLESLPFEFQEFSDDSESVISQTNKNVGLKWAIGFGALIVVGIIFTALWGNSNPAVDTSSSGSNDTTQTAPSATPTPSASASQPSKPSPKPSAKPVDQCVIDNQSISDLVAFKNSVSNVPSGSNDSAHQKLILQWVENAQNIASAISADAANDHGKVTAQMISAAEALTELANLASSWANNTISDPTNFGSQYNKTTAITQSDYSAIVSTCGSKLPGF